MLSMKRNYIKIVASVIILLSGLTSYAQDDHGHSHDEVGAHDGEAASGIFSVYAETKKYELTLKHEEIKPGQEAEMMLYIADYATNEPLSDVEIKMTVQEDPSVVIDVEAHEPGIYHIHAKFPDAKSYAISTNLISQRNGPDLILLSSVQVGVAPLQETEAGHAEAQHTRSDWWKYFLVFAGGLGVGYLFLRWRPKATAVILVLITCYTVQPNLNAHGEHGADEDKTAGDNVFIPKETQFLFNVVTQPVSTGDFQPSVELFGTVIPSPSGLANITTPQSARVTSLRVSPGQRVTAGQVVAVMQPSVSLSEQVGVATETGRLNADVQGAYAELKAAEKERNRLQSIADIAAKKDVQAAEARYNSAKANYDALKSVSSGSVISSGGSITLKAPISGTVGQFALATGAEVMAGTTLFSITNLEKVYVEAQVYDRDSEFVLDASKYTVTCTNQDHETTEVRIISTASEVNPSNQSQKVIFELINPDSEFKIGEFVTLHAFQKQSSKTRFVPNSALSEISGKPVLFVKESPEVYVVRYISPGEDNGTHTIVLKGIEDGDRYVTAGTYQVKMMMLNQ